MCVQNSCLMFFPPSHPIISYMKLRNADQQMNALVLHALYASLWLCMNVWNHTADVCSVNLHACISHEMLEVCLCAFIAVRKFLVWVCRFCRVFVLIGAAAWVGFNEPQPWPSPPPLSVRLCVSAPISILPELLKHLFPPVTKQADTFVQKVFTQRSLLT